jgi:hypothetical protein
MSDDARKQPKFPCDYDVPKNAFWNDLECVVGRLVPKLEFAGFPENLSSLIAGLDIWRLTLLAK